MTLSKTKRNMYIQSNKHKLLQDLINKSFEILHSFHANIVSMFISSDVPTHAIATHGLPIFALGFIPFDINLITVGYFQSIKRIKAANTITILRGFVFMIILFILLPKIWENNGVWLAIPATETLTALFSGIFLLYKRKQE